MLNPVFPIYFIARLLSNIFFNSKLETRNSKLETRNSKLETRNSKPRTRNLSVNHFARFLSIIFHPVFMVTYAAVIYFFLLPSAFIYQDPSTPWRILAMLLTSTVFIPITMLLFLTKLGTIKSMRIEDQKERNWPLLLTALVYFTSFYILQGNRIPVFIKLFLLGATLGILLSLLINLRWKISLHMIGVGGLCGGIVVAILLSGGGSVMLLVSLFFISGLLGTARLYLNAHSPAQILAGFLAGFAIEFGLMMLLLAF